VPDEAVIATGDRHEPGARNEAPAHLPALPHVLHELQRNTLVLGAHDDRHRNLGRMAIDVHCGHLLEESPVNRKLSLLAEVKERQSIPRRKLLGPAAPEPQGRSDQDERSRMPDSDRRESYQSTERAAHDDSGRAFRDLSPRRFRHRLETELLEGRDVQVRRGDLESLRPELLRQRRDLPPFRGGREPVQIEDGSDSDGLARPSGRNLQRLTELIGSIGRRLPIRVFSVLNGRQKDDAAPVVDLIEDSP
jgi:hypothetical protein